MQSMLYLSWHLRGDRTDVVIDSDATLQELGAALMKVEVDKDSIGWGLEELESAANEALERESDSDDETEDEES